MLNMLGLVRKSPEICSTPGEVVDVEMRSPPPSIEKKTENFPPEREVVDVEMRSPPDIQIEPEKCSQVNSLKRTESIRCSLLLEIISRCNPGLSFCLPLGGK